MRFKIDIFILHKADSPLQEEMIESFSNNECFVQLFTGVDKILTSPKKNPRIIILDEPLSNVEKKRVTIKLENTFPLAQLLFISPEQIITSSDDNVIQHKTRKQEKLSVILDEMIYYITYKEDYIGDTLQINIEDRCDQRNFFTITLGVLGLILIASFIYA